MGPPGVAALPALVLLWPTMLPWLAAVGLPVLLVWWAMRQARVVRWGAMDLMERAARAARLTRGGVPKWVTLVRMLMLTCVALAATRPFFGGLAELRGQRLVVGDPGRRIEIVGAEAASGSGLAIQRAVEALARGRSPGREPSLPPSVSAVALHEAGLPFAGRRLIILGDGVLPAATDDAARIAAAVRGGDALLICLGAASTASPVLAATSACLEGLAGVAVRGTVALADEAIEARDGPAGGAFSPVPGPRVSRAAELVFGAATAVVLARTASEGRPLIIAAPVERGMVCVSAIPLSLPSPDATAAAWSDMAAWPAFVPLVDRLVTRLLTPPAAERGAAWPGSRLIGLPLAGPLLACGMLLAVVEAVLSWQSTRGFPAMSAIAPRAIGLMILGVMLVAWGGRPRDQPAVPRADGPIAVLIDRSPSMSTPDAATRADLRSDSPRIRAVLDALVGLDDRGAVLDRLARRHPVEVHTVAGSCQSLGRYPAEISAG